ncbi:UvrD-helicase domain-containing protein [Myxococcota bacterium]|nr:UvrD-helicase domain-containing protein [Myxococcota bacterium]
MSDEARSRELASADAQARRVVQQDFERPLLLEAGAGTGKTSALIARMVVWCLGPGWERARQALDGEQPPAGDDRIAARVASRLVAITFTEAAAAEMGVRVAKALAEVEAGELPEGVEDESLPESREESICRARALRSSLDQLVVQTVHAYCRRLLSAHALEAGLHPRLEVDADGRIRAEVVRHVLSSRLSGRGATGTGGTPVVDHDLLDLVARGVGLQELENQLLACLRDGLSSEALSADPFPSERCAEPLDGLLSIADEFRQCVGEDLRGVSRAAKTQRVDALVDQTRNEVQRLRDALEGPEALIGSVRWLSENWEKGDLDRLRTWSREGYNQGERAALGGRTADLAPLAAELRRCLESLRRLDPELLVRARPVVAGLLGEVESELRTRGVISFESLLLEARNLLRGSPEVAARIRTGIDQLLVDEFQDTDPLQYDIVRELALVGEASQRPGLLLVGDPKQSIYAWRRADLAAFEAFAGELSAAGGRLERLSVNYRSLPLILDEVECSVEPVMQESAGVQPAFQPLLASPKRAAASLAPMGRRLSVEHWVLSGWDAGERTPQPITARDAANLEARALAKDLRDLHDTHGVSWKDCALLFRSRGDWEIYLEALRNAGIPYHVAGDTSYYKRREIIEATALVASVFDPNDHLALLTWLRGSAVGVPDAALIALWAHDLPDRAGSLYGEGDPGLVELAGVIEQVAGALPAEVPGIDRVAGWHHNLIAALVTLARARERFLCDPGDRFVEWLREATLFEVSEASRYLGTWRSANLDRFFRELAEDLAEGVEPAMLVRRLLHATALGEVSGDARPRDELDDAVSVLTCHVAKGLDFPYVYLVQAHKGSSSVNRDGSCVGRIRGRTEYKLLGAPTLGWADVEAARKAASEAERVRLLYVAMTRARDRLVVSGVWPDYQRKNLEGQLISLLEARGAVDGPLADRMAEASALGTDRVEDSHGVLWVFPALDPLPLDLATATGDPSEARVSRTEVEKQSARLADARADAKARMERPTAEHASDAEREREREARAERAGWVDGEAPWASGPVAPNVARCVGTAIHRVLEGADFGEFGPAEGEASEDSQGWLNRGTEHLNEILTGLLEGAALEEARAHAHAIWERFARGSLAQRLSELAPRVVARELPVLLPVEGLEGSRREEAAVGFVSGAVDLVYRDPETDECVVVDYKTEAPDDEVLEDRAAAHAAQGAVYQRALRDSLGLSYTPRFEVWFLARDRVIAVSGASD